MTSYAHIWSRLRARDPKVRAARLKWRREHERGGVNRNAVTVTLCHRDTRQLVTRQADHPDGKHAALREAVAGYPPEAWRVLAVSTISTILADLKGRTQPDRNRPEYALLYPAGLGAYLAD